MVEYTPPPQPPQTNQKNTKNNGAAAVATVVNNLRMVPNTTTNTNQRTEYSVSLTVSAGSICSKNGAESIFLKNNTEASAIFYPEFKNKDFIQISNDSVKKSEIFGCNFFSSFQ